MCRVLVSCADFEAILTPFTEVIRNRCLSFLGSYLHNLFRIGDFPINSLYTQAVSYTTYAESNSRGVTGF